MAAFTLFGIGTSRQDIAQTQSPPQSNVKEKKDDDGDVYDTDDRVVYDLSSSSSDVPLPSAPADLDVDLGVPDSSAETDAAVAGGVVPPLSHKWLLRQSCALSAEAASRHLTHLVMATQDAVQQYLQVLAELSNILEDPLLSLAQDAPDRSQQLQQQATDLKKKVRSIESEYCTFVVDTQR